MTIVNDCKAAHGLEYWAQQNDMFSRLAPIAQELLTTRATQVTYVEQIFSLCGMLIKTTACEYRFHKSLENACLSKAKQRCIGLGLVLVQIR